MRIETHGQQIDVTPAMRDYVDSKFARLGRHFDQPLEVRTLLSVDRAGQRAEGTVTFAGRAPVHAVASGVDIYAAIDLLADKLDRLLVKHKEKQVDSLRRNESASRSGDFA